MRLSPFRAAILAVAVSCAGLVPAFAQEKVMVTRRVVYPGETVDIDALREVTLKPGKVAPVSAVRTASRGSPTTSPRPWCSRSLDGRRSRW